MAIAICCIFKGSTDNVTLRALNVLIYLTWSQRKKHFVWLSLMSHFWSSNSFPYSMGNGQHQLVESNNVLHSMVMHLNLMLLWKTFKDLWWQIKKEKGETTGRDESRFSSPVQLTDLWDRLQLCEATTINTLYKSACHVETSRATFYSPTPTHI